MDMNSEWMLHTAKHVIECKKQSLEEWSKCGFCFIYLNWYESLEPLMDELIKEQGADPNKLGSDEEVLKEMTKINEETRSKFQ